MAYDEKLAQRIREVLERRRGISEKKMFGGLAFLLNGHMACGVQGDDLMVRVGPDEYESALRKTGARPRTSQAARSKAWYMSARVGTGVRRA